MLSACIQRIPLGHIKSPRRSIRGVSNDAAPKRFFSFTTHRIFQSWSFRPLEFLRTGFLTPPIFPITLVEIFALNEIINFTQPCSQPKPCVISSSLRGNSLAEISRPLPMWEEFCPFSRRGVFFSVHLPLVPGSCWNSRASFSRSQPLRRSR